MAKVDCYENKCIVIMLKIENGRDQLFRYKSNIFQINASKIPSYKPGLTGCQGTELYKLENQ